MRTLYETLLNRRQNEKHVAYVESHDEALVGDKTLSMWLMRDEIYRMEWDRPSPVLDRGVALHKIIRLLTFAIGGDAYMNFMGNEFGHPDWIDFPREGNGFSYEYARRQWSLEDNKSLRFHGLGQFDRAMLSLDLATDTEIDLLIADEGRRVLAVRRGPLVFVCNFHPTESYPALVVPVPGSTDYQVILSTDSPQFSGHDRVAPHSVHPWMDIAMNGWKQTIRAYVPSRTAIVLAPAGSMDLA